MATLFIKMEFDGMLRCPPAIDEAIATVREERIVGSKGDEQRRRVGRNSQRRERTVDVADEGWLRILAGVVAIVSIAPAEKPTMPIR